jgi:hypothetical protein
VDPQPLPAAGKELAFQPHALLRKERLPISGCYRVYSGRTFLEWLAG